LHRNQLWYNTAHTMIPISRYFYTLALALLWTSSLGLSCGTYISRREAVTKSSTAAKAVFTAAATLATTNPQNARAASTNLKFQTSSSGIQWADAKVGNGYPLMKGEIATIDYVLATTGARYGSRIYSTADKDVPYRWTLGDGSTIAGMEQAILGDGESLPPMLPGGIRRLVIPQSLGYPKLAQEPKTRCVQGGQPGPIPPPSLAFEEYQRFKNIYCNSNRQYQPDLVIDVKLYGPRTK
jgi:FKBP-type peptidyl-prolyl cis-trans isomerase